jgi:hypothetical protein
VVVSWQKGPEYIPSQVKKKFDFFFTSPSFLFTVRAALGHGRTSSGVAFFSKELPTCAIDDDVRPIDSAVRV